MEMIFKNVGFADVVKDLEIHFNVEINLSGEIEKEKINAIFFNKTLKEILNSFKRLLNIEYKYNDNNVIITKGMLL